MHFKMQNVHLSTFYRICKVARLEVDEMLEIIEWFDNIYGDKIKIYNY